MDKEQGLLIERLRAFLAEEDQTREVSMFGGRSFMVNDKMIVSALRDGDLLVRIAPEQHHDLATIPGASTAEMGAGRSMGPGWMSVSADTISGDEQLLFWVEAALGYNRALKNAEQG